MLDSGIAFEDITLRYNTRSFAIVFPDGRRQDVNYGLLDVPDAAATDLAGPNRFATPYDFTWNDVHPVDTLGHGTHVAGTIGQLTADAIGEAGVSKEFSEDNLGGSAIRVKFILGTVTSCVTRYRNSAGA